MDMLGAQQGKALPRIRKIRSSGTINLRKVSKHSIEVVEKSDFIFIAVPTPIFGDYSGMDMSIVEEVVEGRLLRQD